MRDDIDDILRMRRSPPSASMLAERIIANMPPRKIKPVRSDWGEIWRGFAEEFLLPQPAFALAIVLVTGITFGFSWSPEEIFADNDSTVAAEFSVAGNMDLGEDFL